MTTWEFVKKQLEDVRREDGPGAPNEAPRRRGAIDRASRARNLPAIYFRRPQPGTGMQVIMTSKQDLGKLLQENVRLFGENDPLGRS